MCVVGGGVRACVRACVIVHACVCQNERALQHNNTLFPLKGNSFAAFIKLNIYIKS